MRRALILLLVYGVVELMRPLGSAGYGSQALLTFGFLLLAAYTVGEIAKGYHAPKIVGYLLAGVVFGPAVLEVASSTTINRLAPISQLAIALIAFLAGAELRWEEVRERGLTFAKIMSVELAFGFVALASLVYGARTWIPFLESASTAEALAFALLFGSIAIVHSPAVTMALLTETGARGPVARTTLGIVLLADVVVVLLFSAVLTLARALVPAAERGGVPAAFIVWEIAGALVVGAVLGIVIALYLRFVGEDLFLFAIIVALLGSEVARLAHVEVLLTMLTAGFVTENVSRVDRAHALRHAMERSAAPVFVVFFALAGARIDIQMVATLAMLVIPLALVRAGAIYAGTQVGGRWAGVAREERRLVWMGLVSQAGVAIGLATLVGESFPPFGDELRTLMLALIAVNETVGPFLFRRALVVSREVVEMVPSGELQAPVEPGVARR
jgi:Kef-type K+ transport system membrane component KefB